MDLNAKRAGSGPPLLLIHGLAGSRNSFDTIFQTLAARHKVVAVDLPGFGETPALPGEGTMAEYADALTAFIDAQGMRGVNVVGSSMGARLAIELARRGVVGKVVALDPGGFWSSGSKRFFGVSVGVSIKLVNVLRPLLPFLAGNPVTRTLLLPQFTPRPWAVKGDVVLPELQGFSKPGTKPAFRALSKGPDQEGAAPGQKLEPMLMVWGRRDYVTPVSQATVAQERFPDAEIRVLDKCGHFPHWDLPDTTAALILDHVA